jgi:8-oxo-dGTP diphosphatase
MDDIVCGLLVRPTGEVLVGLRSGHKRAYPSYWDVFGGHVEPGETFEAALARELREELGIAVTDFTAIGTRPAGRAVERVR